MRLVLLPALSLFLVAAAPAHRGLIMTVPIEPSFELPAPRKVVPKPSALQPAPLPNRRILSPQGERASIAPTFSPSLLQHSDTYRGEGFSPGSSAQADQDKRVRPGAGFNLKMPFAPN